jgi:AbrB family looped-hinge helix DNA binding protein
MPQVTVSSKYQVVIPRELRERLKIRKGQKMLMLAIGNRIELVPDRDISEMKGIFPGLSTEGIRDEEDRV